LGKPPRQTRRKNPEHIEEGAVTPKWPGLVSLGKTFLYGSKGTPKALHSEGTTDTTSEAYDSMNKSYRWFRQDELVRKCLVTNSFYACLTKGFETVLEPVDQSLDPQERERLLEDYAYVKTEVDARNKRVNMDWVLFVAQVKRSIFGKAGFEVVLDPNDLLPDRLIPLKSEDLKPKLNENWELTGYEYKGKDGFYAPEEVLYFTNIGLEADYEGLSDIEGIRDICKARNHTFTKDIPEIVMTLWAPFLLLQADTSGLDPAAADTALTNLANQTKPGKRVVVNESVEGEVLDMKPDTEGLVSLLDKMDERIIGNFGTPKFLVGKPIENRATAYAELEAFVEGPVSFIQRYFKREIERQWYDPLTEQIILKRENLPQSAFQSKKTVPVVLKHRWNPIRTADVLELYNAVTNLYGQGMGVVDRKTAWDLLGLPKERFEEAFPEV